MSQSLSSEPSDQLAPKARAAWQFFQQMLADVTKIVTEDAESERELLEGLRVIARVSSLCSQLSVEADPDRTSVLPARYLNRLSDLLFILGRVANPGGDVLWVPGGPEGASGL